jgi:hypothetical protein
MDDAPPPPYWSPLSSSSSYDQDGDEMSDEMSWEEISDEEAVNRYLADLMREMIPIPDREGPKGEAPVGEGPGGGVPNGEPLSGATLNGGERLGGETLREEVSRGKAVEGKAPNGKANDSKAPKKTPEAAPQPQRRSPIIAWFMRLEDRQETKRLFALVRARAEGIKEQTTALETEIKSLAARVKAYEEKKLAPPNPMEPKEPEHSDGSKDPESSEGSEDLLLPVRPARHQYKLEPEPEGLKALPCNENPEVLKRDIEAFWRKFNKFWNVDFRGLQMFFQAILEREAKDREFAKVKGERKTGKVDEVVEETENAVRGVRLVVDGVVREGRRVLKVVLDGVKNENEKEDGRWGG